MVLVPEGIRRAREYRVWAALTGDLQPGPPTHVPDDLSGGLLTLWAHGPAYFLSFFEYNPRWFLPALGRNPVRRIVSESETATAAAGLWVHPNLWKYQLTFVYNRL